MAWTWLVFESFADASWQDRWGVPSGATLGTGPHDNSGALTASAVFNLPFTGTAGTVGTIGARVKRVTGTGQATLFDQMTGTNVNHWRVSVDETHVYVAEGSAGNIVGSAPHGVNISNWFYIEFQFNVNSSGHTGVYINGEAIWTSTVAYWNASSTTANAHIELSGGGGTWAVSDLYCHDSRAEADLLGPVYVVTLLPTADGDLTDFTGSYTDIDEQPPSTADSITSTTAADKSTFVFEDLPTVPDTIYAVRFDIESQGAGAFKTLVRSSGDVNANGGTHYHPVTWGATRHTLETNPVTASAWTESDVNNSDFGVEAV